MRIGGLLEGPGPPRGESHLLRHSGTTQLSRPHPSSLHPTGLTLQGDKGTLHQLLRLSPSCPLLTAPSRPTTPHGFDPHSWARGSGKWRPRPWALGLGP